MKRVNEIAWSQVREAHEFVYGGGALRRLKELAEGIRGLMAAQHEAQDGAVSGAVAERLYWTCQKELMSQVHACLDEVLNKIRFIHRVRASLEGSAEELMDQQQVGADGERLDAARIREVVEAYGPEQEDVGRVIRLVLRSLN